MDKVVYTVSVVRIQGLQAKVTVPLMVSLRHVCHMFKSILVIGVVAPVIVTNDSVQALKCE